MIPATSEFYVAWIGKFNSLPAPKVYQNGKYDISYLCRYNLPVTNWRFDTAVAMHCWYSELPKDLAFLNAFLVRECRYWKHEAHVGFTSEQYYLYNAHDCHNTANAMMAWLVEAPQWAKDNYVIEFPLLFPCHLAEMTGIKMDNQRRVDVKHHWDKLIESANSNLSRSLGVANFNVNSPKQVGILKLLLGCDDIKSGDEKSLAKASTRHPLNELLFNQVLKIRGYRKLVSTYLKDTGMALEGITNGTGNGLQRILFSLNPYNTDTGRLASKEHSFWLGVNIQNQPRNSEDRIKEMYVADKGFLFGEADYEQAESRGTGYISGDTNLINATESELDFHTINASKFFGIPYNEITNPDTGKVINKSIRDLSKRTNHGANYNMGAQMMLDTMGEINVIKAKNLLGLPHYFTPLQVCEYLLEQFGKTYPVVRFDYQAWIKNTIKVASKLVSAYGWTRWCFGNPSVSKPDLNSLIAHCPQNLNAGMLNEAWLRVFTEIWLVYPNDFKLCAQIHDSILFQYRIGCEFLIDMVANCMRNPVVVTDISGLKRVLIVPVAVKSGGVRWSDCS